MSKIKSAKNLFSSNRDIPLTVRSVTDVFKTKIGTAASDRRKNYMERTSLYRYNRLTINTYKIIESRGVG